MIQEYLFTTDKYKADLESLVIPEKVFKEVEEIEDSECWTLTLSIDSESEEAAKLLDPLNIQICEKYNPTVLSNECSVYFNKSLFPIANEFERKLRKLLYLASSLQGDNESHNVISDLEVKDLGEIFTTLFSDVNFVKGVKELVNQKTWQFTRTELLAAIEKLEENTLWAALLGNNLVKTLCKRFGELRTYRNDVMHAHNIDYNTFKTARNLFKKVNSELDLAIGKLIGAKKENEEVTPVDFNSTLSSALAATQSQVDAINLFATSEVLRDIVSRQPIISQEVLNALSETSRLYTLKAAGIESIASIRETTKLQRDMITSATRAMREIEKQFTTYKIDIPPAVKELQQRLSEINFGASPHNGETKQDDEEENSNG
mgnify:CR=1 FL=1